MIALAARTPPTSASLRGLPEASTSRCSRARAATAPIARTLAALRRHDRAPVHHQRLARGGRIGEELDGGEGDVLERGVPLEWQALGAFRELLGRSAGVPPARVH